MTISEARQHAFAALSARPHYDDREAEALSRHLLCEILGVKPHELVLRAHTQLTSAQHLDWQTFLNRLLAGEPLQYITGRAPFIGLELEVNGHTLIPRPETEELVRWIATSHVRLGSILDVGTGSGAIALTLKEAFPAADVRAIDIDPEALATAQRNALRSGLPVTFRQLDVLTAPEGAFAGLDLLVSNPPYIPALERHALNPNVEAWEPPHALFVPDDNPLLFYKALARLAPSWLAPGGWVYVECHAYFAGDVLGLFETSGLQHTELKQDLQGRDRMVRGQLAG
jgi:release factor glutamine methyltransferase